MNENDPNFQTRLPSILAKMKLRGSIMSNLSFAPVADQSGQPVMLAIIEDATLSDGFAVAVITPENVASFGGYLLRQAQAMGSAGPMAPLSKGMQFGTHSCDLCNATEILSVAGGQNVHD